MPRTPHVVVERAQALAEPGAARPVGDPVAPRRATAASGSRDDSSRVMRVSRVPSANASTRARPDDRGVQEAHEARGRTAPSSRSRRSSSTSAAAASPASTKRAVDRLAAGAQRAAHRAAQVGRPRRCDARPAAPRRPQRAGEPQVGHQPARLGELGRRVRGEVACRSTSAGLHRTDEHRRVRGASAASSAVGRRQLGVEREHDLARPAARVGRAPRPTLPSQNAANARS